MLGDKDVELDRLRDEVGQLRDEADYNARVMARLRAQLAAAREELVDLRAIRDALTPPELPQLPGMDVAASFLRLNAPIHFFHAATLTTALGTLLTVPLSAARRKG